jgi:hypothetical protein
MISQKSTGRQYHFLKPAMNEKEEKDYDALNVEIYLNNY